MFTRILRGKYGIMIIIAATLLIMLAVNELPLSTYRSQWEITAEAVAIGVNGEVTNPPPIEYKPIDPLFPWSAVYKFSPSSNLQYDFDNPEFGMPDIKATVGDIREEMPKFPYAPLENNVGDFKYITEYHEYLFDVQIRTIAGVKGSGTSWLTETSMPYEGRDNLGPYGSRVGKPFDGDVYVRFVTSPWGFPDFGPAPENYVFNGYWLGVMNAKIENWQYGKVVQEIEEVHKG